MTLGQFFWLAKDRSIQGLIKLLIYYCLYTSVNSMKFLL